MSALVPRAVRLFGESSLSIKELYLVVIYPRFRVTWVDGRGLVDGGDAFALEQAWARSVKRRIGMVMQRLRAAASPRTGSVSTALAFFDLASVRLMIKKICSPSSTLQTVSQAEIGDVQYSQQATA